MTLASLFPRAYHHHCNYSSDNNHNNETTIMSVESAYRALGLEPGASMDNVKAAYRRLALQCHPDLHTKDGSEFLRISAAYQQILNKNTVYDFPRGPHRHYGPDIRAYPGPSRFNQTAVTVWGLGLAMGCVLFGAILLWSRAEMSQASMRKGPSRFVEPSSNAIKRERIAALLLERSKARKDSEK